METHPVSNPVCYLITSAKACSVTMRHGEESITWKPLPKAGQAIIVVPPSCTLQTEAHAHLFPLPHGFRAVL